LIAHLTRCQCAWKNVVYRRASLQHHRGRAKKPSSRVVTSHCAIGPNQVWSWNITWMPAAIKGQCFYWYMVLDVFSRKIVGHEVHGTKSAELASLLMRRASLAKELAGRSLVLHSDNGSAMKSSTMLATLEQLGVAPSFSRPTATPRSWRTANRSIARRETAMHGAGRRARGTGSWKIRSG
jgi:transposase InsO family protein